MSKSKHIRIGFRQENVPIESVRVGLEDGDGRFTIYEGAQFRTTSLEGFHAWVEQVYARYFEAVAHRRYLDSLLPVEDRPTVKRKRGSVVA